ncbi:MAG: hypothetical protein LKE30_07735 [Bacteroidales bacterium]|jgi:hypothetical protein|nr:hypothetical protein [Bacteroidales bacterium]
MKKKNLLLIAFGIMATFISISAYSQKVYCLKDEKSKQIFNELEKDTNYCASFGDEKTKVAFENEEDVQNLINQWYSYLQKMGDFLAKSGCKFNEKVFLRVYFDEKGKVDYIFYNPQSKESPLADKKTKKEFENSLKEFAKTNSLDVKAKYKFKQCGTANFQLKEKK